MKIINLNDIQTSYANKPLSKPKNAELKVVQNTNMPKLANPSSENLRANYLVSFTGSRFKGVPTPDIREDLLDIPFYNTNADDLAIVMGPNKSAIVTYGDETAKPELLAQKFVNNLKNGKYKRNGFDPNRTRTFILNNNDAAANGKNINEDLKAILESPLSQGTKVVIFVPKFLDCMSKGSLSILEKVSVASEQNMSNVQIVGFMQKEQHDNLVAGKYQGLDKNILKDLNYGKVELKVPGEKDTKLMLKKESKFIGDISKKYEPVKIHVSPNAINEVVDKSSKQIAGEFPGKALQVLDLVVAAKVNEVKQKNPNAPIVIASSDVDRFFDKHSEIIANLKAAASQFKQADIPKLKFSDVGGAKEAKEVIKEGILAYIKNPKEYINSGGKAPKGILLHGGPGTGKTLLAKATAGEAQVPFFSVSGSEFVEKYVGVGASRVRELFGQARNAAKASDKHTAIIFIDEIDAVGKKRGDGANGSDQEADRTLNQILTEMDGFNNDPKCNVIVMAATNRVDILDDALKRPGRFDDVIEIPNPTASRESRLEILKIHAKNKPFENNESKDKILNEAAQITSGLSGAEIAEMMNKAAKIVIKREKDKFITPNDMVEAYLQVQAGPIKNADEDPEYLKEIVVSHECGHALVGLTINDLAKQPWKKVEDISFITLDARGGHLGAVYYKPGQKGLSNIDSVIASAALGYAGGIAGGLYQDGGSNSGVSGDLRQSTQIIDQAITKWGLGSVPVSIPDGPEGDKYRTMYQPEIKEDIKVFTTTAKKIAKLVTDFNKDFIVEYVDNYKQYQKSLKQDEGKNSKAGKTLSGEGFKKLHDEWLVKSGKDKEQIELQQKISILIDSAKNGKLLTDAELEQMVKADKA